MKIGNIFQTIGRAIWRHKYLWTIIGFVLIVGFIDENSFLQRYRLYAENEETQAEVKRYEDKYTADEQKLHQLKSDPQALIRVAREDHQMRSADEDVYYIVYDDSTQTNP